MGEWKRYETMKEKNFILGNKKSNIYSYWKKFRNKKKSIYRVEGLLMIHLLTPWGRCQIAVHGWEQGVSKFSDVLRGGSVCSLSKVSLYDSNLAMSAYPLIWNGVWLLLKIVSCSVLGILSEMNELTSSMLLLMRNNDGSSLQWKPSNIAM
jgi:hypothetical protein